MNVLVVRDGKPPDRTADGGFEASLAFAVSPLPSAWLWPLWRAGLAQGSSSGKSIVSFWMLRGCAEVFFELAGLFGGVEGG